MVNADVGILSVTSFLLSKSDSLFQLFLPGASHCRYMKGLRAMHRSFRLFPNILRGFWAYTGNAWNVVWSITHKCEQILTCSGKRRVCSSLLRPKHPNVLRFRCKHTHVRADKLHQVLVFCDQRTSKPSERLSLSGKRWYHPLPYPPFAAWPMLNTSTSLWMSVSVISCHRAFPLY